MNEIKFRCPAWVVRKYLPHIEVDPGEKMVNIKTPWNWRVFVQLLALRVYCFFLGRSVEDL